jgi:type IV secretion system protein VirD4
MIKKRKKGISDYINGLKGINFCGNFAGNFRGKPRSLFRILIFKLNKLNKLKTADYDGLIKKWFGKKTYGRYLSIKANWRPYSLLLLICLYLYGMLVNCFIISSENFKFNLRQSTLTLNPIKNIFAVFSRAGMGTAFFFAAMYILITKKYQYLLTGVKVTKDERGFFALNEGTHGTSGWLEEKEAGKLLEITSIEKAQNPALGKLSDNFDDYVCLKDGNGLTRHILVYGATGAGKSRGFVKPFILKTALRKESMIIVDPKAEFFESMSEYLKDGGYTVKAFNLLDMENSDGWNCLSETASDVSMVQSVAQIIISNTSSPKERDKHEFWPLAELNLLMALMHYVQGLTDEETGELLPTERRSLGTIYNLLSEENILSLDQKFKDLPNNHPAKKPYGIFRQAAHALWGNIAIGLGSRLNVFQNRLVDTITKYHDIDLELPGQRPCAYFCIISDQESSLEFLSSLFFSLLFKKLSDYSRKKGTGNRLPVDVNFILEEFCVRPYGLIGNLSVA